MVNDFIGKSANDTKIEIGDVLSRQYRVVKEIKKDDFGTTYEVVTKHTGDTLTLTIIPETIAQNAAALKRIKDSVLSVSTLSEENLVGVFSSGEHLGMQYFVTGYFSDTDLAGYLATNDKLSARETIRILTHVGPALASAHSQGMVHGDVRPNQFWCKKGGPRIDVRLGGISVAYELRDSLARVTGIELPDTNIYRAPECLLGKPPDALADQYSLAACCYEFLSGMPPFVPPGLSDKILNQPPAPISDLPDEINEVLQRGLSKNIGERYGDCAAFAAALLIPLNKIAEPDFIAEPEEEAEEVVLEARPERNKDRFGPLLFLLPLILLVLLLLDIRFAIFGFAQAIGRRTFTNVPIVPTKKPTKKPTRKPTPKATPTPLPTPSATKTAATTASANIEPTSKPTPTPPPTPASLKLMGAPASATIKLLSGLPTGPPPQELSFGAVIDEILPGRYFIVASAEGFIEQSKLIDLKPGGSTTINIELEEIPKIPPTPTVAPTKPTPPVAATTPPPSVTPKPVTKKPIVTKAPTPTQKPVPLTFERVTGPGKLKGAVAKPQSSKLTSGKLPRATKMAGRVIKPTKKPVLRVTSTMEVEGAKASAKTTEIYDISTLEKPTSPRKKVEESPLSGPIGTTVPWGPRAMSLFDRNHRRRVITRNSKGMRLAWIPSGSFYRGSPAGETGRQGYEGPRQRIALKKGFWLGVYEVTRRQYAYVMGGRFESGANLPQTSITWHEAQAFCERLTDLERKAGILPPDVSYTLPTETMWEYACRATTEESRYGSPIDAIAWYSGNSQGKLKNIGGKKANKWGLHDMLGNASEWCADVWVTRYAPDPENAPEPRTLPFVFDAPMGRVWRGGASIDNGPSCRAAFRRWGDPDKRSPFLGFRISCIKGDLSSM